LSTNRGDFPLGSHEFILRSGAAAWRGYITQQ
jgi:hypothetical protein